MTKNRLERIGIKNIRDLLATEEYILLMRGISLKQLEEIKKHIAKNGLHIKENQGTILDKPVRAAHLSLRTKNVLRYMSKIKTIKDLENLSYEELCKCRNMGKKSLDKYKKLYLL